MVDTMMQTYLRNKEEEFVTQGGIKERMTAARLGYRTSEREALAEARCQIQELSDEITRLRQENTALKRQLAALGERGERG
jgi:four helix bundle suffix protein